MKFLDIFRKEKKKVFLTSSLMLLIPEIIYKPITYYILWMIIADDDILLKIRLSNIISFIIVLTIQSLGIVVLAVFLFLLARETINMPVKKIALYFFSFIFFLLLCFVGFIFVMLYVFSHLSIGL